MDRTDSQKAIKSVSMPMGIIIERRESDHPWQDYVWHAVDVIPGAPAADGWRETGSGDGWVRYHAATLALELFRKETEGYKYNLSTEPPRLYVVSRKGSEADDPEFIPFHVTACPYEAQDYQDSGEETVDPVPMPAAVAAWVAEFIETHHVEEVFRKRKRSPRDPRKEAAAEPPPVMRRNNTWKV